MTEIWQLRGFIVRWPEDDLALNPRLVHSTCGSAVCDIEEKDDLGSLADMALMHQCRKEATE